MASGNAQRRLILLKEIAVLGEPVDYSLQLSVVLGEQRYGQVEYAGEVSVFSEQSKVLSEN
jgi:hypothetical protein